MKKDVFILRSIPGAGKTTIAEEICANVHSSVICCADDYFTDQDTGEYNWVASEIGKAHMWCQSLFKENLEDGTEIIVVSNTNVTTKDVNTYRKVALEYGYRVFVLTVENWHEGKDVHNVPDEVKVSMREKLKNSIKL